MSLLPRIRSFALGLILTISKVMAEVGKCSGETCAPTPTTHPGRMLLQRETKTSSTSAHASAQAPAPAPFQGELAAAPQPHLVRAKKAKEDGRLPESKSATDDHHTQHGCHCIVDWTYNGEAHKSCSGSPSDPHAGGYPWCEVNDDCKKSEGPLSEGHIWDHCSHEEDVAHLKTVHGCHCSPRWDWEGVTYEGCARTSKGPKWCSVFEGDVLCPQALRTEHFGQHWDYCFESEDTSPFLTYNGCHCAPEWPLGEGRVMRGCSAVYADDVASFGCAVLEDDISCTNARSIADSSLRFDTCFVPFEGGAQVVATLDRAGAKGCYCRPAWMFKGVEYNGCANAGNSDESWCSVVSDDRLCTVADGELDDGQRWRYCKLDDTPSVSEFFLTRHGCHCLQDWEMDGQKMHGCDKVRANGELTYGCAVVEDATVCPGARNMKDSASAYRFDVCSVPNVGGEAAIAALDHTTAAPDCHCQPVWTYNGDIYEGCAHTGTASRKWCYIIEDDRLCKATDGLDALTNMRWSYCEQVIQGQGVPVIVTIGGSSIAWHGAHDSGDDANGNHDNSHHHNEGSGAEASSHQDGGHGVVVHTEHESTPGNDLPSDDAQHHGEVETTSDHASNVDSSSHEDHVYTERVDYIYDHGGHHTYQQASATRGVCSFVVAITILASTIA